MAPLDEYTFVDFGAGMGRGMLLAAEYNFRQVIGVELNPILVKIARRNMTLWRKSGRARSPMRIRCEDAVEFPFPKGPCVAFLFNPFGAPVLRKLLRNVESSFAGREGHFDLIYANYEHEAVLEQQAGFSRLFVGPVNRSRADAIADHSILANQPDGEYASANHEDCSIWRWAGKTPKS
jgi:hypothetical protein